MSNRLSDRLSVLAPLVFLFTLLAISILLLNNYLFDWGVDPRVLHGANTLLFVVTSLAAFWMAISLRKAGGPALLKAIYGGFMIRFFVLAGSAFIYILSKRKQVNIPGLAGAGLIYVLYLLVEIRSIRSHLKSGVSNG